MTKQTLFSKTRLWIKVINFFEKSFQEKTPSFEEKIEVKESLIETIAQIDSIDSLSQAKRLIKQGAVDIDGKTIKDINYKIKGNEKIKVGKKVLVKVIKPWC